MIKELHRRYREGRRTGVPAETFVLDETEAKVLATELAPLSVHPVTPEEMLHNLKFYGCTLFGVPVRVA